MQTVRKANLCLAFANDHVQQCGCHAQQADIIAIGHGFGYCRAQPFHPSSGMIDRERGGLRGGKRIAGGGATAKLGQEKQLDAHMVLVLAILVA